MRTSGFRRRAMAAGVCAAVLAVVSAGCSDSGDESGTVDTTSTAGEPVSVSRYATPLQGVCPDPVVVQTSWWPNVDYGHTYQLLGANPKIDKENNRVTGPLGGTGVSLEIRAGGPALGFQPQSSLLYEDDDILLGYLDADEAIQNSAGQPTVAVLAPYDKTPLVFLWGDPAWDFTSVADIGREGAPVLTLDETYTDVFLAEKLLAESQIDTSYEGSPSRFVAEDGKIVQIGFVTDEPYRFEHDVPEWGKPVKYLHLHDEYPTYANALAIRADKLEANSECLSKLVPLFQQSQRDYATDPGPTNELILGIDGTLDTGAPDLSSGLMTDGNAKQLELGLIADGHDGVLGSFDTARLQKLIDRLTPVLTAEGTAPKPGLTSADVVTNEFLDTSISLK